MIQLQRGSHILRLDDAPLQQISFAPITSSGIKLFILRGDLIHPHISGNKAWKLRDNFLHAIQLGKTRLVTFGGAYSNHLLAVAAAAHELGFESMGIVRGEEKLSNPLLGQVQRYGMKIIQASRTQYRDRQALISSLSLDQPENLILPEGGTNELALPGCADALPRSPQFDHVLLAVGTGGSLAGFALGAATHQPTATIHGIAVLKGADYLAVIIQGLVPGLKNWCLHHDWHEGGYAKTNSRLLDLIARFKSETAISLEPCYTGKALLALCSMAGNGTIKAGQRVLCIHTGGLFNSREPGA